MEAVFPISQSQCLMPLHSCFLPEFKPLDFFPRPYEKLHFHLLEFPHSHNELPGHNLITERLAYLCNPERDSHATGFLDIEEIHEYALGRFRPEVDLAGSITDRTQTGIEHQVELPHLGPVALGWPCRAQSQTVQMSRDRLQGFQHVLEAQGAMSGLCVEVAETWDYEAGYDAAQRILAKGLNPTAVFAAGDASAIGAMRAIREMGLHVPQDISMIGVDDLDSAPFQNPPLTTIRQSITELAVLGLQLLFDLLDGEKPKQTSIVMEPELIVRQSTSPPPGVENRAGTTSDPQLKSVEVPPLT